MRHDIKQTAYLLIATALCALFVESAAAQFSSSSRTGSASGNALTSSSSLGGASGLSSGFGAIGAGSNTGNRANTGGNSAANRTAGNGQNALGQSLFTQGNNQNGFIGGRNQQQQFIGGNQQTGANQNRQQANQGGNRAQQGRNNLDDLNGMNQQNQSGANQRRVIRPQQKVAFDVPRRTETEIRSTLQTRFDGLSEQPALRGVTFHLDADGVATLSGSVETASAKQLAANFVRLEPGVRKVVNELTVP